MKDIGYCSITRLNNHILPLKELWKKNFSLILFIWIYLNEIQTKILIAFFEKNLSFSEIHGTIKRTGDIKFSPVWIFRSTYSHTNFGNSD